MMRNMAIGMGHRVGRGGSWIRRSCHISVDRLGMLPSNPRREYGFRPVCNARRK
jgi:hypothetical protein